MAEMVNTIDIDVPDGVSGNWRVESFEVTEDNQRLFNMRIKHSLQYVWPGTYKRLMYGSTVVMSNTSFEIRTHQPILSRASGDVLIHGLGLGMVVKAVLAKPEVKTVTVIERSEDVIRLVAPTYANDLRFTIICADALTWRARAGVRFNTVWHDIWPNVCADNLEDMARLHRRWGGRCEWQGSWSHELCLMLRKRARKRDRRYW